MPLRHHSNRERLPGRWRACGDRDKGASKNRDSVAERITPVDITKAQRLAKAWWAKHGKKR